MVKLVCSSNVVLKSVALILIVVFMFCVGILCSDGRCSTVTDTDAVQNKDTKKTIDIRPLRYSIAAAGVVLTATLVSLVLYCLCYNARPSPNAHIWHLLVTLVSLAGSILFLCMWILQAYFSFKARNLNLVALHTQWVAATIIGVILMFILFLDAFVHFRNRSQTNSGMSRFA